MELKKNKNSRTKTANLTISLVLLLVGCAVPFETADTKNIGESEIIVGYTVPLNVTARTNFGVTGYTDLGIGLDMGAHLSSDPVFCLYGTGKQKILNFGGNPNFNLLVSGAYGLVATDLNPENIPYYHYTLLLGMENEINGLTFGIGVLQDPRFSWEIMHEEFSKEKYIHAIIGVEIKKMLFQIQTVHKSGGYINFGFGVKL